MRSFLSTILTALVVSILVGGAARAQIGFSSFGAGNIGAGANQVTLNGDAALSGSALRLTSALEGQAGSAWYNARLLVGSGFSTRFRYNLSGNYAPGPADGVAFLLSADPGTTSALGNGGSDLGFNGLASTLGITFDTFEFDAGTDVGIHVLGSGGTSLAFVPKTVEQMRGFHDVRIDFANASGGVGDLSVFFDGVPEISLTGFDLNPYFDTEGTTQAGFSAGTGLLADDQDILSWQMTGAVAVPEPATPALLVLGALGTVGALRRRR